MGTANVVQSVLNPAGPQAAAIHTLWTVMLWVTTTVFVITLVMVFAALGRGRRARRSGAPPPAQHESEPALSRSVAAATAVTVLTLFALLIASIWTSRSVVTLQAAHGISIAVTGHQWWWEIEYEDSNPSLRVRTANEIHIPVGRPVALKVTSRDVIHSFWVPNLQGKRDLIPGYTTAIWMQADRPGQFRGQCAEFCGLQHAHMAFTVVAEDDAAFEAWLNHQRQSAVEPQEERARRGREIFMAGRCAACHAIQGTPAHGTLAPELTHIATRDTVGAGTLSTTREHLREWVRNPQEIKPGVQMPANPLPADTLDDLVAYLETLR
jgi:cytochrome c oxidase subunit 2